MYVVYLSIYVYKIHKARNSNLYIPSLAYRYIITRRNKQYIIHFCYYPLSPIIWQTSISTMIIECCIWQHGSKTNLKNSTKELNLIGGFHLKKTKKPRLNYAFHKIYCHCHNHHQNHRKYSHNTFYTNHNFKVIFLFFPNFYFFFSLMHFKLAAYLFKPIVKMWFC